MVQADTLSQPDVRELWRDLTGRRASKMKKYNLVESHDETTWKSEIDPTWTVMMLLANDDLYDKASSLFDRFGLAFAELGSKVIFMDGEKIREESLSEDHILAIEAHEIAHHALGHQSADREYEERQEQEADWFGIRMLDQMGYGKASGILEHRYSNYYGENSDSLENTEELNQRLMSYLK